MKKKVKDKRTKAQKLADKKLSKKFIRVRNLLESRGKKLAVDSNNKEKERKRSFARILTEIEEIKTKEGEREEYKKNKTLLKQWKHTAKWMKGENDSQS
jgi:hypothetical protein